MPRTSTNLAIVAQPLPIFLFTRYEITPNCKVEVDRTEYFLERSTKEGHYLLTEGHGDRRAPEFFSHQEFYKLMVDGRASIRRNAKAPHMLELARMHDNHFVEQLSDKERIRVEYLLGMLEGFEYLQSYGRRANGKKVSKSRASMEEVIPTLHDLVQEHASDDLILAIRHREITAPSPSKLLRMLNHWKEYERDPLSLATLHHGPGPRVNARCYDSERIWAEHVNSHATNRKPRARTIWKAIRADIEVRNLRRPVNPLRVPSYTLVLKMVAALGNFRIVLGQEGFSYARKLFKPNSRGQLLGRVGQRVEMDEWRTDLMSILETTRYYKTLSKKKREELEKTNVWVSAIIDTASRYILAMRFSLTNTAENALATIDMMTRDKSEYGHVMGAETPWHGHCGALEWVTDQGKSYMAKSVREAIGALGWRNIKPIAGHPDARGFIERLFGTLREYLKFLDGQTFSNIWEKGEYDPAANATVTVDFLNKYLVRAIVDVYHREGHGGLKDESPQVRFTQLTSQAAAVPPPGKDLRRTILGTKDLRVLSANGILVLGIHYHSDKLLPLFLHSRPRDGGREKELELPIRIDRLDMSAISVWTGDEWIVAENTCNLPQNVSAEELILAAKRLTDRNIANNGFDEIVYWKAFNDLRLSGEAAAARAGLGTPRLDAEAVRKAERQYAHIFNAGFKSFQTIDIAPIVVAEDVLELDLDMPHSPARRYVEVDDGEQLEQVETPAREKRPPRAVVMRKPDRAPEVTYEGEEE